MKMSKLYLGTISGASGYNGKFRVHDIDEELPNPINSAIVYVGFSEKFAKKMTLEEWTLNGKKAVGKFIEINSDKEIYEFKENGIFIEKNQLNYDEDEKAEYEYIGYNVINIENKELIGELAEIWKLPANDVWLIKTEKGELPLPVIDQVILKIDSEKKEIIVNMIDGLEDLIENDKI